MVKAFVGAAVIHSSMNVQMVAKAVMAINSVLAAEAIRLLLTVPCVNALAGIRLSSNCILGAPCAEITTNINAVVVGAIAPSVMPLLSE
jgi:hypothetical protein